MNSDESTERVDRPSDIEGKRFESSRFDTVWKYRLFNAAQYLSIALLSAVFSYTIYRLAVHHGAFQLSEMWPDMTEPSAIAVMELFMVMMFQFAVFLTIPVMGAISIACLLLAIFELWALYLNPVSRDGIEKTAEQ